MRRALLLAFLIALWAFPAFAVNEGHYPQTIVDTNCTDAQNTPAAPGEGGARPQVQTSGSADGYCDHDARIVAAAITVDTVFGPFKTGGSAAVVIWADADVVSNDTDTWQIDIIFYQPHDNTLRIAHAVATQTTEGNKYFIIGPAGWDDIGVQPAPTANIVGNLPDPFYIQLKLGTATSWDGSISWRKF